MGWKQWLGLQSVERTITDHTARIVTPDPQNNPMQRFKASLPAGALDAPVATWPREQLAGYLVATCEHSRSAFPDVDDWAIRSGSALANLLFDAHLPQLAVPFNFEGTREGVAQEVGTFRLVGHDRRAFERDSSRPDASDHAHAVAADPDLPVPGPHLAPLWADQAGVLALYGEVDTAFRAVPGHDDEVTEHAVVKASAYLLNVLEYLSTRHLVTYNQVMKGLSKASETDAAAAQRRLSMAYEMAVERVEIALPAPTVTSSPAPRRPM